VPQEQRVRTEDDAENENAEGERRSEFDIRHSNVEIAVWRNNGTKGEFLSASIPAIRHHDARGGWKGGGT
jgi:hypothetical protein